MAENKNEVAETKATAISTFDDTLLSGRYRTRRNYN